MKGARLALAVSLVAAVLPIAACTGGDDGEPPIEEFAAERAGSRVALDGDTCTYDGAGAVWAGPVVLEVVNERDGEAFFEIVRLADGVTFSDLYEGPGQVSAGPLAVEVVNETDSPSVFGLLRIAEAKSFEDVTALARQQQERLEDGGPVAATPDWLIVATRAEVAADEGGTLLGDVTAGSYALVCVEDSVTGTGHVAASIEVLP